MMIWEGMDCIPALFNLSDLTLALQKEGGSILIK